MLFTKSTAESLQHKCSLFVDKPMVLVSFDEIQFFTKQFAKFLLTAPRCELKLV